VKMWWSMMGMSTILFLLSITAFPSLSQAQAGQGAKDLIARLPNLKFKYTAKQYAGYLNATDGQSYFYWFLESQNPNNTKDPIIVWLGSYPGCSSLIGLLTGIGPFRPTTDAAWLWENVFSWNKLGHLLFIDGPTGVGWSYMSTTGAKPPTLTDDTMTNYYFQALRDFFNGKFPAYQTNELYLAGEGYNGILIPLLAKKIDEGVKAKPTATFPNNLKGIAIGNGMLSARYQFDAMMQMIYHRGFIGTDEWDKLLSDCVCSDDNTEQKCSFYSSLTKPTSDCAKSVNALLTTLKNTSIDAANIYRDCYAPAAGGAAPGGGGGAAPPGGGGPPKKASLDGGFYLDAIGNSYFPPTQAKQNDKVGAAKTAPFAAQDPSHQMNYDSTDALLGFSCWGDPAKFLSSKPVMQALHVAASLQNAQIQNLCKDIGASYTRTYLEMKDTLTYVLKTMTTVRTLLFAGDADLEYNFLGQEWFIDRHFVKDNKLAVKEKRVPWNYRGQLAGYSTRYANFDEVIIKGAGRHAAMDRAGPALQMIANFVRNGNSYSNPSNINVVPKPNSAYSITETTLASLVTKLTLGFISFFLLRP